MANPGPSISEHEYLERERAAEFRSDYYAGYVYDRPASSWAHATVVHSLSYLLGTAPKRSKLLRRLE